MQAEIEIDLATAIDVPRMLEFSNWAAAHTSANFAIRPDPLEPWMTAWQETHPYHPWLVARQKGRVVGFAKSSPHRSREAYAWTAESSVYIDPEHHGQGIGTKLYEVLLPLLRKQGYVTLLAGITTGHQASERLHTKMGFVWCGAFHRSGWKFDRWHDVGWWELHLQPKDAPPQPIRPVREVYGFDVPTRP